MSIKKYWDWSFDYETPQTWTISNVGTVPYRAKALDVRTYYINGSRLNSVGAPKSYPEDIWRPIAEILSILEIGRASEWEQFREHSCALLDHVGDKNIKDLSWVAMHTHENPSVREAYNSWQMFKALSRV